MMIIDVGNRIWWRSLNDERSGVVEELLPKDNCLVRLDNGKQVIVNELSVTNWE